MQTTGTPPLSGRRAQAARNDDLILAAARHVFVADPTAPISAVARRAGVGIAALYRRYAGKEDLLRRLCHDGLTRYNTEVQAALADDGDPWDAFRRFMERVVEADTHSLTIRLAGTFTPTDELNRDAEDGVALTIQFFDRTRTAGVLRPGLVWTDLPILFEQLALMRIGDEERTWQLRRRYLTLILDALRGPGPADLPGPPPDWSELARRWEP